MISNQNMLISNQNMLISNQNIPKYELFNHEITRSQIDAMIWIGTLFTIFIIFGIIFIIARINKNAYNFYGEYLFSKDGWIFIGLLLLLIGFICILCWGIIYKLDLESESCSDKTKLIYENDITFRCE